LIIYLPLKLYGTLRRGRSSSCSPAACINAWDQQVRMDLCGSAALTSKPSYCSNTRGQGSKNSQGPTAHQNACTSSSNRVTGLADASMS
jgi:hypothetical protein